jgi:hypothetical protein
MRNPTNIGRHQLLVMQRSKRCVQMHSHPTVSAIFLSAVAVSSSQRSRQFRPAKLLFVESGLPDSIAIFAHEETRAT